MITSYKLTAGALDLAERVTEAVWIDLYKPDDAERAEVSALLGFEAPSRDEQQEIEQSARLYLEGGTAVMTALIPARTLSEDAEIAPVTFILARNLLVTIRHHQPLPFETFPRHTTRAPVECQCATTVFLGLMEEIIGRIADITEHAGRDIDTLSRATFRKNAAASLDMQDRLQEIGRKDGSVMMIRESLLTLDRLLGFLGPVIEHRKEPDDTRAVLKNQVHDLQAISEQAGFLMQKTSLLLDATLGMISIEQNAIIKIFSVAAVAFLPPTLIASVYGMNFRTMPELDWAFGYPTALLAMVISAALPLYYFKRKGWF